mmetsp:Transcript_39750/g.68157  ORF Transcript_39750/g.68157 Transcript_39750/m.68157 type:complete len:144 (+) Transcript_39750:32-463(+)
MKVTVCTLASGESHSFDVENNCTTGMLKDLIHQQTGVEPDFQELRQTLKNGTQIRKLCYNDLELEKLDTPSGLNLELVFKLAGGDDEDDEGEYGPSPDHILCCCGFRKLSDEFLCCCLTVGCGVRDGKPLCEVCFSSCTCNLL